MTNVTNGEMHSGKVESQEKSVTFVTFVTLDPPHTIIPVVQSILHKKKNNERKIFL